MSLLTNLIPYWKLDEASGARVDSNGTNNLAEAGGAVSSVTGVIGNAVSTDGLGENLQHASNADLDVGLGQAFTFTCWVQIRNGSFTYPFVQKFGGASTYEILFNAGVNRFELILSDGNVLANTFGAVPLNTWCFVAAGYDGVNGFISVNAGTEDTFTSAGGASGSDVLQIAGHIGYLDEVGFWKRALTGTEIAQLYNSGAGLAYPFTSPTSVPWWAWEGSNALVGGF